MALEARKTRRVYERAREPSPRELTVARAASDSRWPTAAAAGERPGARQNLTGPPLYRMPPALRRDAPAATHRRRRRARLLAVVALTLGASLLLAPSAFANFLTPKSGGSPNADSIPTLYKIVLYIALVVFVIVEGALVYSVYKFRAKKGAVAAQIHGNTRLEIGWTVAAALILVVLTVVTFVKLPGIINPPNSQPTAWS